jgi:hypothetical protein
MRSELASIRDTGELSDRISATLHYVRSKKRRKHVTGGRIQPGTKAELGIETVTLRDGTTKENIYYAPAHIEFGTKRSRARSFMRNALRARRQEAFEIMRKVIAAAMVREFRRQRAR